MGGERKRDFEGYEEMEEWQNGWKVWGLKKQGKDGWKGLM